MSGKAESRLIYSSISTSERVASLGTMGALLFTWFITHCDSQGRMQGSPKVIKLLVVPLFLEISEEDIVVALDKMVEKNLAILYNDEKGRQLIQIADWWDWQTGLKYWPPSHYQAPSGWIDKVTTRDERGRFDKQE